MTSGEPCEECLGTGVTPDPDPGALISHKGRLERGWRRRWLLIHLAQSEGTHRSLAAALGVHTSAVQQFRARHLEEIEAIRTDMAERFVGLWIADKINRLREYEQDVDDINGIVTGMLDDPERSSEDVPTWMRTKHAALRAVADELGDIPNRMNLDVAGHVVSYQYLGVDVDQV